MIFADAATKLTISQIAEHANPPHLIDWLRAIPESFEAEITVGLCAAAVIGSVMSWLTKWSQGEAQSFFDYAFKSSLKRTVAAVLSGLGIILGLVASDIYITNDIFVGWAIVLTEGFMIGFGSDSAINRGKRVEWDEGKRLAARNGQSTSTGG
jgi:hypothetical protein